MIRDEVRVCAHVCVCIGCPIKKLLHISFFCNLADPGQCKQAIFAARMVFIDTVLRLKSDRYLIIPIQKILNEVVICKWLLVFYY